MIRSWLRRRRRKKLLAQPFPAEWDAVLDRNVRHVHGLSPAERDKLRQCVQIFVAERYWEGCGGLEMTDEVRVTVAGQACLLVLGFDNEYFDRLLSVLVYPDSYVVHEANHGPGGILIEGPVPHLGETWSSGPVILAWTSVLAGGRHPDSGQNVVLHEFAHYLDIQDREFDGTPPLKDAQQYRTWSDVMTHEYNQLVHHSRRSRPTLLDPYGAQNPAEFFAVATEAFFEKPREMKTHHPELYEVLQAYYRQDPQTWVQEKSE